MNMRRRLAKMIILSIISIIAMIFSVNAENRSQQNGIDFFSLLDKKINHILKINKVPGVAIGIIESENIIIKCYGLADVAAKKPITSSTVFQIASISKVITAWGIMKLYEDGKINIDDPIEKYLKRWKISNSIYDSKKVTIRNILNHSAGLSVHGYAGTHPNKNIPSIIDSLNGVPLKYTGISIITEPGKGFNYSGGGYTLLQLLIEDVTNLTFEKYMHDEILLPLGMAHSSFDSSDISDTDFAIGYGVFKNPLPRYNFTEKAAAGLNTTIDDMMKFISYNLNLDTSLKNPVLKKETVDMLYLDENNSQKILKYATSKEDNYYWIFHGGANRGWRSFFGFETNSKNGFVCFTNSDYGNNVISYCRNLWADTVVYNKSTSNTQRPLIQKIIYFLCAGIFAIFVISLYQLIKGIITKKRIFVFEGKEKKTFKIILATVLLIIIAAWWYLIYASWYMGGWVIAAFLPVIFEYISWGLTLLIAVLILKTLFPKIS